MDSKEILNYCVEKGLLIEPEVLNLFKETNDGESVKLIIEKLKNHTQKKVITKRLVEENKESISEFFFKLPEENKRNLERLKVKLGLKIEISKEFSEESMPKSQQEEYVIGKSEELDSSDGVKVLSTVSKPFRKKIEVQDFVGNLRSKFIGLKNILQEHRELENLVSVSKLTKGQRVSIIGMVGEKRVTKNGNILLDIEDLTGRTRVLINQNKPDIYKQAEDITPDSVLGFIGSGDREIFFANNIVFPDAVILDKKKSPKDERVLFVGDIHYGSHLFLEDSFRKFIDYLNGKTPNSGEVDKIKYLFIVGDLVSGVGNYPSQFKDLKIKDLEEQFQGIAELLGKIRKDIKIIVSPGNHDGVRLLEPQPFLDEKYAWPLYNLRNIIMTGNPATINLGGKGDFPGFDVLTYHGFSYPFYANNIPSLIQKGMNAPEDIMKYLMKHRHLAPTHSSVQYIPYEEDELVIKNVPDIFVSGHSHKCAVSSYNNILIVSTAAWESETEYQKRKGNKPDFCKVPMMNMKTGEIKILDFE
ncbi:MAG: metallophosphoesterase [Candidatus Pacearchaeota archaeon]